MEKIIQSVVKRYPKQKNDISIKEREEYCNEHNCYIQVKDGKLNAIKQNKIDLEVKNE